MRSLWHPSGCAISLSGSRAENCSQITSMMYGGMAGTGMLSFRSGSLRNSPNDRASVSALHVDSLPIGARSKAQPNRYEDRCKEKTSTRIWLLLEVSPCQLI